MDLTRGERTQRSKVRVKGQVFGNITRCKNTAKAWVNAVDVLDGVWL
jgi:hypothetical protein